MAVLTFTLKVHINCCSQCTLRAKEKLENIQGVDSVTIDATKGLVTISGSVEPTAIIEKFAKWGKKAELWSLHKEHIQSDDDDDDDDTCSNNQMKKISIKYGRVGHKDHDGDSDSADSGATIKHQNLTIQTIPQGGSKKRAGYWGWLGKKFGIKSSKSLPPAAMKSPNKWRVPWTPTTPEVGAPRPFYGSQHRGPVAAFGRPPIVPPYPLYGSRPPPGVPAYEFMPPGSVRMPNPMTHYTSYEDNYRYFP